MGWIALGRQAEAGASDVPTCESVVAFAERHGWDYAVHAARERRVRPNSYAEQFTLGVTKAAA
jgi:hypothetical protein